MERRFTKQVFMTAWRRLSLTLLVALCCHTAASAETLPVYDDGTDNSQYVPVYGFGADAQGTTSEFVIPKEQLGAMEDGTISALTFYLQTRAAAAWTATIQVYLKEISATTLTGITGPSTSTVVYTGTLDATKSTMTVTFDNSYTYNGGNLLIGTYIRVAGNYNQACFYGVTQSVNTACYKKDGTTTSLQFIPKTTFTYTPPSSVVSKPEDLAASNITYEQATITWSSDQSAWNIAWSTDPDFDPASALTHADNVSVKTYTITDLIQMTDYYVAVQDAVSGKWSPKLHFKTTAQPTAVGDGWTDDFEGATCGWELFNGDRTNRWVWGTAVNNGGTHALYISNDYGTTNAYNGSSETMVYAAKLLTFTEGTFDFSYDWQANGESSSDYLRVALVPETASLTAGTTTPTGFSATGLPTGWIALDGGSKLNLETDWQSKVATIDVAAGNYYLVFAWRNDYAIGNNPPAAIDNVSISKYPDEITNLAVSDITTTAATVSWNGNGDSYNVRYRKQFISEDFEGGMPTGWTSEGDASWSVGKGDYYESTGSHSGDYNAKITHTTKDHVTFLITPSMDLSGETSLTLSFWYINRTWGSDKDGFGVYYRVGTEGTWTELWRTTEAHASWTNQEVTLTGLAANYQLGFKMTDGFGYGVGLDDIQITSADWQTVNDITDKSITLTGLAANTPYGCQVQSVKAGKTSLWSPIATFTTLELESITLADDADNSDIITAYNSKKADVTLGRTLQAGGWNTFSVPFEIDPIPSGWTVKELTQSAYDESTKALSLTFTTATKIEAGKPYLVQVNADVVNPSFNGVTITESTTETTTTGGHAKFVPAINPTALPLNNKNYLFVSGGNKLTWASSGSKMNGFRAYFQLLDDAASQARTFKMSLDDETVTGIINAKANVNDNWYDLQGRMVQKPTAKGMYIQKGKKVIK